MASGAGYTVLDAKAAEPGAYVHASARRPVPVPPGVAVLHNDGRRIVVRASAAQAEEMVAAGWNIVRLGPWPIPPPSARRGADIVRAAAFAAAHDSRVATLIAQVDQASISQHIAALSGASTAPVGTDVVTIVSRHTMYGSPLHSDTQYALERLQAYGLSTVFGYWTNKMYTNRNVYATIPGTVKSSEYIYVTAHIDDTAHETTDCAPGADDNASGVAAALAMAEILGRESFERSIRFALFTGEEQGLYGSSACAHDAAAEALDIVAVFNMDMLAWDSNGDNRVALTTRVTTNLGFAADVAIAAMFTNVVVLYDLTNTVDPMIISDSGDWSDHWSFWQQNYPAICAIEYYNGPPEDPGLPPDDFNYANNHSTNDILARANIPYCFRITRASLATIAHLAALSPRPLPFVDITNAPPAVVSNLVTTVYLAGTNTVHVAGDMSWTNHTAGTSGPVDRDSSNNTWSATAWGLVVGANRLVVHGTNLYGDDASGAATVIRLDAGVNPPFVDITNGAGIVVTYDDTTAIVGGTNCNVVGDMGWSNTTAGAGGVIAATSPWTSAVTGLVVGMNEVYVYGTNEQGAFASDFIAIERGRAGTGIPFLDVTTTPAWVAFDAGTCAVSGTNNGNVVGGMWVTNPAVGGASMAFPAAESWTAPGIGLAFGTNTIAVYGTNAFGALSADTVEVARAVAVFAPVCTLDTRDPTNAPRNVTPTNGETISTVTPELRGTPFRASYPGELHFASQWQVSLTESFVTTVWDSGQNTSNRITILVPPGILDIDAPYWWHVRHKNYAGGWSPWSTGTVCTVVPEPVGSLVVLIGLVALRRRVRSNGPTHRDRTGRPGRRTTAAVVAACVLLLCAATICNAEGIVSNVFAVQRPGEKILDITYDLYGESTDRFDIAVAGTTNGGASFDMPIVSISGDVAPVAPGTNKHIAWDAGVDWNLQWTATLGILLAAQASNSAYGTYCVLDVSSRPAATNYPVTYFTGVPTLNDAYKTTKILLRRIPAGSFAMGSPTNELGRYPAEDPQHRVTLSSNFYMGVFEITQGQYSNVMGTNPAWFPQGAHGPKRPVELVSWDTIRGGAWPGGTPGATTFMGIVRIKTSLSFDLPTEAQWEYACRAGTTGAWNNGTTITNVDADGNLDILGRYWHNGGHLFASNDFVNGAHTAVGSYHANNWGLYDMHGNVWEWCLDWYADYGGDATDPAGPAFGSGRVTRGGTWGYGAGSCRSANRDSLAPGGVTGDSGFRLVLPADH